MNPPVPPVVIDTGSELLLFRTFQAAEGYLEPIDVESGEYPAAYDGRGQLLALATEERPVKGLAGMLAGARAEVTLRPLSAPADRSLELATKARSYLEKLGEPAPDRDATLATILEQVGRRAGFIA